MSLNVLKRLSNQMLEYSHACEDAFELGVSGLRPFMYHHTSKLESAVYCPLVCVVLQGEKEMTFQERTITMGPGTAIVVSQYLSVAARISKASKVMPYLALVVPLDVERLRKINGAFDHIAQRHQHSEALRVFDLEMSLASTLQRILELLPGTPEAALLADIYCDELHARLLLSAAGDDLRLLLTENSRANRIALAVAHIRQHLERPCNIAELLDISGMSNSTFHVQFKITTGTTPLRFQKDLRLLAARSSLASSSQSISQVAYDVGYASPSQFAREYKRKFGNSPRQDRLNKITSFV